MSDAIDLTGYIIAGFAISFAVLVARITRYSAVPVPERYLPLGRVPTFDEPVTIHVNRRASAYEIQPSLN